MNLIKYCLVPLIICCVSSNIEGAYTIRDGWFVDVNDVPTMPLERHFQVGMVALEHRDWSEAATQFHIVSLNSSNTTLGQDAYYYLGIAFYQLGELDLANEVFTQYLQGSNSPEFFEEAVTYKFNIANHFCNGAKKHSFGWKSMPKWSTAHDLALQIYDEVIAAMPSHDMAARALYAKAQYIGEDRRYRESIEVYQQLIRRFPHNELTPAAYLAISKIYLEHIQNEMQNPDLLALAQINLRKFSQAFPRDERILEAEKDLMAIKETYANSLYETGVFFERKGYSEAAILYYSQAVRLFPDTIVAKRCQMCLCDMTRKGSVPVESQFKRVLKRIGFFRLPFTSESFF